VGGIQRSVELTIYREDVDEAQCTWYVPDRDRGLRNPGTRAAARPGGAGDIVGVERAGECLLAPVQQWKSTVQFDLRAVPATEL
jgi:hypothetical protein